MEISRKELIQGTLERAKKKETKERERIYTAAINLCSF